MPKATTMIKADATIGPTESRGNAIRTMSNAETASATQNADRTGSCDIGSVHVAFTFEYSLPSELAVLSPFIEKFMQVITNCRCISGNESNVEIALREALVNAIVHGNHEDPRKNVQVHCRCERGEISMLVRDEGEGFDAGRVPDPTAPENILSPPRNLSHEDLHG